MKFALQKVCVPKIGFPKSSNFQLTNNSCRNGGAGPKIVSFFRRKPKISIFGKFPQELYAERALGTRRARTRRAPHADAPRAPRRIIVKNRTITTKGGEEKALDKLKRSHFKAMMDMVLVVVPVG